MRATGPQASPSPQDTVRGSVPNQPSRAPTHALGVAQLRCVILEGVPPRPCREAPRRRLLPPVHCYAVLVLRRKNLGSQSRPRYLRLRPWRTSWDNSPGGGHRLTERSRRAHRASAIDLHCRRRSQPSVIAELDGRSGEMNNATISLLDGPEPPAYRWPSHASQTPALQGHRQRQRDMPRCQFTKIVAAD